MPSMRNKSVPLPSVKSSATPAGPALEKAMPAMPALSAPLWLPGSAINEIFKVLNVVFPAICRPVALIAK